MLTQAEQSRMDELMELEELTDDEAAELDLLVEKEKEEEEGWTLERIGKMLQQNLKEKQSPQPSANPNEPVIVPVPPTPEPEPEEPEILEEILEPQPQKSKVRTFLDRLL